MLWPTDYYTGSGSCTTNLDIAAPPWHVDSLGPDDPLGSATTIPWPADPPSSAHTGPITLASPVVANLRPNELPAPAPIEPTTTTICNTRSGNTFSEHGPNKIGKPKVVGTPSYSQLKSLETTQDPVLRQMMDLPILNHSCLSEKNKPTLGSSPKSSSTRKSERIRWPSSMLKNMVDSKGNCLCPSQSKSDIKKIKEKLLKKPTSWMGR